MFGHLHLADGGHRERAPARGMPTHRDGLIRKLIGRAVDPMRKRVQTAENDAAELRLRERLETLERRLEELGLRESPLSPQEWKLSATDVTTKADIFYCFRLILG